MALSYIHMNNLAQLEQIKTQLLLRSLHLYYMKPRTGVFCRTHLLTLPERDWTAGGSKLPKMTNNQSNLYNPIKD